MVELHCLDRVMHRFYYKQHIPAGIDTSYAFQAITRRDKNNNYNRLSRQEAYVSQ